MTNTRSGAALNRETVNEMIERRVAEILEARDAARNLELLNADNGNGGGNDNESGSNNNEGGGDDNGGGNNGNGGGNNNNNDGGNGNGRGNDNGMTMVMEEEMVMAMEVLCQSLENVRTRNS